MQKQNWQQQQLLPEQAGALLYSHHDSSVLDHSIHDGNAEESHLRRPHLDSPASCTTSADYYTADAVHSSSRSYPGSHEDMQVSRPDLLASTATAGSVLDDFSIPGPSGNSCSEDPDFLTTAATAGSTPGEEQQRHTDSFLHTSYSFTHAIPSSPGDISQQPPAQQPVSQAQQQQQVLRRENDEAGQAQAGGKERVQAPDPGHARTASAATETESTLSDGTGRISMSSGGDPNESKSNLHSDSVNPSTHDGDMGGAAGSASTGAHYNPKGDVILRLECISEAEMKVRHCPAKQNSACVERCLILKGPSAFVLQKKFEMGKLYRCKMLRDQACRSALKVEGVACPALFW